MGRRTRRSIPLSCAMPVRPPEPVRISLCGFLTADFAGRAVVPMLGMVTFTGSFVYLGTPGQLQPCELIFGEVPCEQRVFIELTAASGRRLTVRGDDFWE